MAEKLDHMKECNEFKVPVEEFETQFCSRCLQSECGRSQHGKSQFDSRVQDWERRLFLEVPRMSPDDTRFHSFQAKKFLDIHDLGPVEVRGWVDPNNLSEPEPEEDEGPPTDPSPPPSNMQEEPAQAFSDGRMNTPAQPKMMVGGQKAPTKPTKPVLDQWEPKKTETSGIKMVQPGAKIKLGS
jgi:hypothetical protein